MDIKEIGWDGLLGILFGAAAAVSLEIASITLFNQSLAAVVVEQSGFSITWASVISLLALGAVWLVNQPNIDRLDTEERAAVVGTLAIVGVTALFPDLLSPVYSEPLYQMGVWAIESAGFWTIATA